MVDSAQPQIHWQPISALPVVGSMIDGLRDEVEQQYTTLQACRPTPHVLDDHTVARVITVYTAQADDVGLYEHQLTRWSRLSLTATQCQDVDRLLAQLPPIRDRIQAILALAAELKAGTIETVLAKSDVELGLDWLLEKQQP